MKKVAAVVGMTAFLIYGLGVWLRYDARYLSSFSSLEELRTSDVKDSLLEEQFCQDGVGYTAVRYRLRTLPPQYIFRWLGPLSEPCLIFDSNGRCVDRTYNYNDDHSFIHRWPALFPYIELCKCGKGNSSAAVEKRMPQIETEESK